VASVDRVRLEKWRRRCPFSWVAQGNNYSLGVELSGGRSAAGAMQGKRIAWAGVLRQRRKPGNDLRGAAEVQPGRRQRRHMESLADMASVIGPLRVLMEE